MASADLGEELNCSVCLDVYTDPVTLRCGHNFCQACINRVLDTQELSGRYFCPDCMEEFRDRSALYRNVTLRNIAERFQSAHPADEDSGVKAKNCSIHHKILKYYCAEDSVCICATCLTGQHRGHRAETMDEALENKRRTLRNILKDLTSKQEEMEKRVQRLQERKKEVQAKAAEEMKKVSGLIGDIMRRLEDLENRVLSEISAQEEKTTMLVSNQIQQMEIKKDELYGHICHIEELCHKANPSTILEEQLLDFGGIEVSDTEAGGRNHDDLNEKRISQMLLVGLQDIKDAVQGRLRSEEEASGLLLDLATAANNVKVSADLKGVILTKEEEDRPETPLRFQRCQVVSEQSFSSGRHVWEVLTCESGGWRFGMTYPDVQRRGPESAIGDNDRSWCLRKFYSNHAVRHDGRDLLLAGDIAGHRFRVCLDYQAGQLSFYLLGDPIRHLHTFTANFTQPLHAALNVTGSNAWVRITS